MPDQIVERKMGHSQKPYLRYSQNQLSKPKRKNQGWFDEDREKLNKLIPGKNEIHTNNYKKKKQNQTCCCAKKGFKTSRESSSHSGGKKEG